MTVPVKVRTLWIVVLWSLGVVRARVKAVLITLVGGDLILVAVPAIAAVAVIAAIIPPVWILVVGPILRASRRNHSDANEEKQCQQDSPGFASEIV